MHVYDLSYCKVMTIAICDMKSEMAAHQMQMWHSFLAVCEKHGVTNVKFEGFMANSAKANLNAIWEIFGSGDKS